MKKFLALFLAMMMVMATLAGCGGEKKEEAPAPEKETETPVEENTGNDTIKIGVIPYYARDDFYKDFETGVLNKCDELGIELVYQDPNGDPTKALQILEDMATMNLDAICVNPLAQDAMIPQLKEFIEQGIHIVTFDGTLSDASAVSANVGFDFAACGTDLGKLIEQYVTEKGIYDGTNKLKTTIIDLPASPVVGVPIIDNCKAYLEEAGIVEIVAQQDGQADRNYSMGVMENILTANGNKMDLLIGFNYDACMGGVQAAESRGLTDMVAFSQLWGTEAFEHMENDDSMWKGGVAYSPVDMGVTAVQTAYDLIQGNPVEQNVYCQSTLLTHDTIGSFDWESIVANRK